MSHIDKGWALCRCWLRQPNIQHTIKVRAVPAISYVPRGTAGLLRLCRGLGCGVLLLTVQYDLLWNARAVRHRHEALGLGHLQPEGALPFLNFELQRDSISEEKPCKRGSGPAPTVPTFMTWQSGGKLGGSQSTDKGKIAGNKSQRGTPVLERLVMAHAP